MKRIGASIILSGILACGFADKPSAAENKQSSEGILTATLIIGGHTNQLLYTHKANLLRIESTDKPSDVINIVEFDSQRLTMLFPKNSTFVRLDPPKNISSMQPGAPLPITVRAPVSLPMTPSGPPRLSAGFAPGLPVSWQTGPAGLSNWPALPPVPAMPAGMPFSLPMPQRPGFAEGGQLQKASDERTILGFKCSHYTLTNQLESMDVWTAPDAQLFPIQTLQRDPVRRHFGPQQLEDRWVELLRERSLFPMEVTLRAGTGSERFAFRVTAVDKHKLGEEATKLFGVPSGFQEIDSAVFQ